MKTRCKNTIFVWAALAVLFFCAFVPQSVWSQENEAEIFPAAVVKTFRLDSLSVSSLNGGVQMQTLKQGYGRVPQNADCVVVNYYALTENGAKIGQPGSNGFPLYFQMGKNQMIKGFETALRNMKVGGRALVKIPPGQAYGSEAFGVLPPNATLYFYIELVHAKAHK